MKQVEEFIKTFPELYPVYRYEAEVFIKFCRQKGFEFSVDAVRAYNLIIPNSLKYGTYNKRLAAAKKVVSQWVQNNSPADYPSTAFHLKGIKGKKRGDKSVQSDRWHTPEQIRKMQEASSKRTGCMILFLSCTGVRVAEAATIRLSDITPGPEVSSVTVNGKRNTERKILVSSDLLEKVRTVFNSVTFLFETHSHEPYDPDIISRQITRAGKRIGIKSSAHRMRHSFATQFLKDHPGKFKELADHLGHSSVQITMDNYTHNQMSFSDLSGATSAFRVACEGESPSLP